MNSDLWNMLSGRIYLSLKHERLDKNKWFMIFFFLSLFLALRLFLWFELISLLKHRENVLQQIRFNLNKHMNYLLRFKRRNNISHLCIVYEYDVLVGEEFRNTQFLRFWFAFILWLVQANSERFTSRLKQWPEKQQ